MCVCAESNVRLSCKFFSLDIQSNEIFSALLCVVKNLSKWYSISELDIPPSLRIVIVAIL